VHPAFLYAFERCGFLVTEANLHLMTDEQVEQWEAAVDEWCAEHPDEAPP